MSKTKERKVIVPQMAGHDFQKATSFGRVIELLSGRLSPFNLDLLQTRIKKRLREEDISSDDFLVLSGPAVINCLVFTEWLNMHNKIELLLFHSRDFQYIHRTFMKE
jgi:hypothetical protein